MRSSEAEQAPRPEFTIVGIGASAGGLEAFDRLLSGLPEKSGLAVVLVAHLAPDSPTMLPSLLTRATARKVVEATDGVAVDAECVYTIPPGRHLRYAGGRLHVEPPDDGRPHMPIDHFFRSLAEETDGHCIGIVLSGTGSDGTLGLEAIKAAGGVTFASDEASSLFSGMPRAAAASGSVDHTLPVGQIASQVVEVARLLRSADRDPDDEAAIGQIVSRIRSATGHDFSHYKRGTLLRRIDRRSRALGLASIREYAAGLLADPEEPHRLFHDFLVGVTSFFRTPDAFAALAAPIRELAKNIHGTDVGLRAWVAGCSTGEEAYTLAMVLIETLERENDPARFTVFATDIDPTALEIARRGVYPASIAEDVSPERLARFFTLDGDIYRVNDVLRERVIFSLHNLTKDPPFSRLDLLSCRNLLIYFDPSLQKRIFPIFHYALRPGGLLFLGSSESPGEFGDLFAPLDKHEKIYRRQPAQTRDLHFPSITPVPAGRARVPVALGDSAPPLAQRVAQALLQRHVPPCAVIDEHGEIQHVHGKTSQFLELPEGEPSTNLFRMVRLEVRPELRSAIAQAKRSHEAVSIRAVGGPRPGETIDLTVEAIAVPPGEPLFMVVFHSVRDAEGGASDAEIETRRNHALEGEVRSLRDALQTTVEDLESANEELTSSNEELMSMNEELQSGNEELETSKEELQSLNEELASVNAELKEKVLELTRTNNDVTNLLASTQVATIFLDRSLRIARFTPAVTAYYKLQGSDVGRPIGDLTSALEYPELIADAANAMENLVTVHRDVLGKSDGFHIVRVMPYRTVDQRIEGVVITITDVSSLERARRETGDALALVSDYRDAIDVSTQVAHLDGDGIVVHANDRFIEMVGAERARIVGQVRLLDPALVPASVLGDAWATLQRGEVWRGELPLRLANGEVARLDAAIVPLADERRSPGRYIALLQDISEQTRAVEALRASEARFRALFDRVAIGMALIDRDGRIVRANPALSALLGYTEPELVGTRFAQYAHSEDQGLDRDAVRALLEGKSPTFDVDKRYRTRAGATLVVHETLATIADEDGTPELVIATVLDVTEERRNAERLRTQTALAHLGEMAAVVAHEVRNALAGIRAAVDVIGHGIEPGAEAKEGIDEMRVRVASLNDTVENLLRFARPRPPELVPLPLRRVIETVTRSVAGAVRGARIDIHGEDLEVLGDESLLESALLNIFLNGLQAGGDAIAIDVERDDDVAVIRVIDHGHGIPIELRAQVFEPFFTTRARGTGLGLPIAKRIIEAHGGSIAIESASKAGTKVTLELPLAPAPAPD
jgi:two-component system, chemotaxis family, CheB/CheR fusion protein